MCSDSCPRGLNRQAHRKHRTFARFACNGHIAAAGGREIAERVDCRQPMSFGSISAASRMPAAIGTMATVSAAGTISSFAERPGGGLIPLPHPLTSNNHDLIITKCSRRPLVSSARPAARAAGETRFLPHAAPWPGQAWPRRKPSGARSRRSASCAPLREISAQHNRRF